MPPGATLPRHLIYHFTDVENLSSIVERDCLLAHRSAPCKTDIGHADIEAHRQTVEVPCGPGGTVGDYVPFYFAPRSPMLFSISKGNVPGVSPEQRRLVYFVSQTDRVYSADGRCVFTDGNAATGFTAFGVDPAQMGATVDWDLMGETMWNSTPEEPDRRRRRMAEFLVHRSFPLSLVTDVGVYDNRQREVVDTLFGGRFRAVIRRAWYFEAMVEFVTGNLFEANVDALVNTVNTKGVMGKGVALQFKRAFPENFAAYRDACLVGEVALGRMFVTETGRLDPPRFIVNFPTKGHWRSSSRVEDIDAGLADLRAVLLGRGIESVALPPLGCGLGGLDWATVRPRIASALDDLPVQVIVYEPNGPPVPERMLEARPRPHLTPLRAALVQTLSRYLLPGDRATPLEVQKLLYLLQQAGAQLGLNFSKGRYGPYADGARRAVEALEGHFVTGYGDGTGQGGVQLLPGAEDEAASSLATNPELEAQHKRVTRLINRFETPYGLELLTTTHWVASREGVQDADQAARAVNSWNKRKGKLFTANHVSAAWKRLDDHGWLGSVRTLTAA